MVIHPGAGIAIIAIVRLLLGVAITGALVYLIIKLAGLADVAAKARKTPAVPAT